MEKYELRPWEVDRLTVSLMRTFIAWSGDETVLPSGRQVKKYGSIEAALAAGAKRNG